jgi:hypothetical protein
MMTEKKKINFIGAGSGCLTRFLSHEEQKRIQEEAAKAEKKRRIREKSTSSQNEGR